MNTYVILFRGINVSGKNILPMKALSSLLQSQGYQSVKTYIQSGNVVLKNADKPGADLVSLVEQHFGFIAPILVLTVEQFLVASQNNPYSEVEGKYCHFYFCDETPALNLALVEQLLADTEQYQLIDKVFYLHAPQGIGRSKLVAKIEKCLGVSATGRNLNTVNKIQTLFDNMS